MRIMNMPDIKERMKPAIGLLPILLRPAPYLLLSRIMGQNQKMGHQKIGQSHQPG